MKNLIILVILSTLFFSCSKENSAAQVNIPEDLSSLTGTWNLSQISCTDGLIHSNQAGAETVSFTMEGRDIDAEISFSADPNTYLGEGGFVQHITVSLPNGQTYNDELPFYDFFGSGSWTMEGDELILDSEENDPQRANVLELNDRKIRLAYPIQFNQTNDGVSVEQSGTFEYTLER